MKKKLIAFLVMFWMAAGAACGQVYLGTELNADGLVKAEPVKINRQDEDAFAKAFVMELSTSTLFQVFESTTPERAAANYLRQGVYRQEFLMLYMISISSATPIPFKNLFKEREDGVKLSVLAAKHKADVIKLFKRSGAWKNELEEKAAVIDISTDTFQTVEVSTRAANDEKK